MVKEKVLAVDISPVKVGGRARVNSKTIIDLDLEEGDLAIVSSESKDILVSTFSDKFVNDGEIMLREQDIEKLNVSKGDNVSLRKHQSILTKLL
ncbi:MAG: hypothetical protein ACQEQM_08820 [Thermoplasmatota archaeon]